MMNCACNSGLNSMKYRYDIVRAPRKSISINISSDNKITVRCPWGLSGEKVEEFLESKMPWIDKIVMRNASRLAANDDIIEHRSIYLNGKKLPLVFSDKNEITAEAVYIKRFENIEKLYIKYCSEEFYNSVDALAKLTLLTPNSVSIKKYKGRWGCCDAKNNLTFNYILFMLPPRVQRYVIIHELCHILCHNHSQAFWKLVSDYEPEYKLLKKQLAVFDFLTSIY